MQMSPLERERVITKMAYDLTGDGCDPVGKWLLRLPVQTPGVTMMKIRRVTHVMHVLHGSDSKGALVLDMEKAFSYDALGLYDGGP
ncbi:hypothetical protein NDU88_001517 [Pleurodeles waltl]|uniref:Uncharacterized protein n=1 Tax=Pleurodeles waltl TaxID=8319 RepID=A0AAV7P5R5_PLEWA|nr:hypothetical protein NDU88_001517 [Pleurodeles waltl]